MIRFIHIYDLDGTVISSLHRYRTMACGTKIDLSYWREKNTPENIARDSLLPHAAQYKMDLKNPYVYVIVATSRACLPDDANYKFIREKLGFPNKFIHRQGHNDNRKGADLKIAGIKPLLNLKQFRTAKIRIWEDNAEYLAAMCAALNAEGRLIYSAQRF